MIDTLFHCTFNTSILLPFNWISFLNINYVITNLYETECESLFSRLQFFFVFLSVHCSKYQRCNNQRKLQTFEFNTFSCYFYKYQRYNNQRKLQTFEFNAFSISVIFINIKGTIIKESCKHLSLIHFRVILMNIVVFKGTIIRRRNVEKVVDNTFSVYSYQIYTYKLSISK